MYSISKIFSLFNFFKSKNFLAFVELIFDEFEIVSKVLPKYFKYSSQLLFLEI
ncbi:MAG: hypothetical protein LBQ24_04190 [Candidatus Peribacteria bacterium]|nr:hypothetical protein [Candidatus Peribacteria bacterium]